MLRVTQAKGKTKMATAVKTGGKQMLVEFEYLGTQLRVSELYTNSAGRVSYKLESQNSAGQWFDASLEMYSAYSLVQIMACAIKSMTECHG